MLRVPIVLSTGYRFWKRTLILVLKRLQINWVIFWDSVITICFSFSILPYFILFISHYLTKALRAISATTTFTLWVLVKTEVVNIKGRMQCLLFYLLFAWDLRFDLIAYDAARWFDWLFLLIWRSLPLNTLMATSCCCCIPNRGIFVLTKDFQVAEGITSHTLRYFKSLLPLYNFLRILFRFWRD